MSTSTQLTSLHFNTQRLAELGFTPSEWEAALQAHKALAYGENPAVYCGTYHKYNNGSLEGMWLDLTTFDDYEQFLTFCKAFHSDEQDPELMFQDCENLPSALYDECMGKAEFEQILRYCQAIEEHGKDVVEAYLQLWEAEELDLLEDRFRGAYDSLEDYAEEILHDCYNIAKEIEPYIDYHRFARDLEFSGENWVDGYVFSSYC